MNDQEQRFEAWRDEYEAREGHAFPGRLEVWEAAEEPLLARIAELEARVAASGAEPRKVAPEIVMAIQAYGDARADNVEAVSQIAKVITLIRQSYAAPAADSAMAKDAERYRWLRDTLQSAKAGGGVEVNDALQVYEQPVPGEEVRVYWYLHTPIGFHEITAATLDDAIDEGIAGSAEKTGE